MKRLPLDLILLLAAVAAFSAWLCVRDHNLRLKVNPKLNIHTERKTP